jgi:hypothetical protein
MHSRQMFGNHQWALCVAVLTICFVIFSISDHAQGQKAESNKASLLIHSDQPKWIINRNIYGQFAEHLGRLIYEGLWVGEDSAIPNTRGLRNSIR